MALFTFLFHEFRRQCTDTALKKVKSKKKRSANKNGSHSENFWGCLQVFVLRGLAGMLVPHNLVPEAWGKEEERPWKQG